LLRSRYEPQEPTKDQWLVWWATWLGWTLDSFDFTMFLLIMVPISQEFHVPLTDVAFVLSVTLWLRLLGAVRSGWLAEGAALIPAFQPYERSTSIASSSCRFRVGLTRLVNKQDIRPPQHIENRACNDSRILATDEKSISCGLSSMRVMCLENGIRNKPF
jgi:hypothetical protein